MCPLLIITPQRKTFLTVYIIIQRKCFPKHFLLQSVNILKF